MDAQDGMRATLGSEIQPPIVKMRLFFPLTFVPRLLS